MTVTVGISSDPAEVAELRERYSSLGLGNHGDIQMLLNELSAAVRGDDADRVRGARLLLDKVAEQALETSEVTAPVDATAVARLPAELVANDAIREAVEAHQAATRHAQDARRTLTQLENERPAAEQQDVEALADAIRADQRDPGAKRVQALDKRISDAKRNADATRVNEQRTLAALNVALVEHLPAWSATVAESAAHARRSFLEALEALEAERVQLGRALALEWLVTGKARTFNPAGLTVPAPRASDNDRASVDELLGLLRALGEEQKPTVVPHPALRSVDDYDAA